jgi:RNA polymerase sigma factor (sigma-70 family)
MEPKGAVERQSIPATFPYSGKEDASAVKELDCVTLLRLCANDPNNFDAWHEFLSRVIDKVRFFVRASRLDYSKASPDSSAERRTTCQPDQEDLVQDVFLRLVDNDCLLLKRFDGTTEASLFRYLSVIAGSVVINRYKYLQRVRRRNTQSGLDDVDDTLLKRVGLSRDDLKMERSILVREIMQILEEILREEVPQAKTRDRDLLIFKLHLFEDLSLSEISRYCGINLSVPGVEKIIAKITRRLKERFGRQGGEHG